MPLTGRPRACLRAAGAFGAGRDPCEQLRRAAGGHRNGRLAGKSGLIDKDASLTLINKVVRKLAATVKLKGTTDNQNAIGAIIELKANGITQRRMITSGRSFLSQLEYPVTFGLGTADKVDSLVITWPGGLQQPVIVDSVDKQISITQTSI